MRAFAFALLLTIASFALAAFSHQWALGPLEQLGYWVVATTTLIPLTLATRQATTIEQTA